MVTSVQNHTKVPSFCTRSSGSAKVNELEWNGSKYVATLTDTNGVLGNYNFSANIDGVSFSVSGNKLTVSMEKAPSKEFTITAAKKRTVSAEVLSYGLTVSIRMATAFRMWSLMLRRSATLSAALSK